MDGDCSWSSVEHTTHVVIGGQQLFIYSEKILQLIHQKLFRVLFVLKSVGDQKLKLYLKTNLKNEWTENRDETFLGHYCLVFPALQIDSAVFTQRISSFKTCPKVVFTGTWLPFKTYSE